MFYEEQFYLGELHYRSSPKGKWHKMEGKYADLANQIYMLGDVDKVKLIKLLQTPFFNPEKT